MVKRCLNNNAFVSVLGTYFAEIDGFLFYIFLLLIHLVSDAILEYGKFIQRINQWQNIRIY